MRKITMLLLIVATFAVGLTVGAIGVGYWATRFVPPFYTAALEVDPVEQRRANDELLENASALASNVQREGEWKAIFKADQINGWLAVDLAENHPGTLPPEVRDPRIQIYTEGLTLACRYVGNGLDTIASIDLQVYVPKANTLAVRIKGARAGSFPLPRSDIMAHVTRAAAESELKLTWQDVEGDPVALVHIPPTNDGDTIYRLDTVETRPGEIYVAGHTVRTSGNFNEAPLHHPRSAARVLSLLLVHGMEVNSSVQR